MSCGLHTGDCLGSHCKKNPDTNFQTSPTTISDKHHYRAAARRFNFHHYNRYRSLSKEVSACRHQNRSVRGKPDGRL